MKTFRSILNLTGAFLLANQGLTICQADEAPVRIMPLGDSITQGCCSGSAVEGGYRNRLHDLLDSAGYTVDFVGTQNDVSNPALPDTDHQGMPGFQIEQLRAEIATWTKMVEDPDVILLHAGTNDFGAGAQVSTVQNRLQNLIADLSALRPHSHIFVSTLIPRTDNPAFETLQNSFNLSLPQLVSDQVALGRKVHFVDLHGALDPGDLNDGLHPTVAGYEKMADGWSAAVMAVTTPQGTSDLPAVARLDAREDLQHMTVRFSKPVEDAAAAVGNFQISGGVNVLSASLDAASKRIVTLTTTPQQAGALHHLTINGVRDRTAQQLEILPFTTRNFTAHSVSDASFEAGGATWTSSGNQAVVASAAQATDGSNIVVFNASNTTPNGILTQTVPTVPGQAYRLEFDLGVVDFVSASQSMHVTAVGNATLLDQTESLTGVGGGATRWTTKELEFVADSASTTITFEDVSAVSTNIDMLLDDIRLNAGGSPTLTVASIPPAGAPIVVSPLDNGGNGDGTTQFERTFDESTTVNLTAPSTLGARGFDKWQRDGVNFSSSPSTSVTMETDHTMTVVYRLLTNGSFESGSPADVGDFNGDWVIGGTGKELNGTGTGSFKPFGYTEHLASSPPYDAFEGNRMAVFNGGGDAPFNGVIAQDITTVPGTTYSVSFQVGISSTTGGRKQRVTAAATGTGSLLSQMTEVTAPANNTCTWTPVTHTFTADSTTTTISFTDSTLIATAGGSDLLIDDVVVEEVVPRTLTINSTPATGLSITVSPADNGSNSDGTTNFTRTYDSGTDVTLTAPATSGSDVFSKWQRDGVDFSINATAIVTMDADHTMTAVYSPPPSNLLVNGSFETGAELVATVHELESWNPLPSPTAAGTPFGYVADGSAYTTTDGLRIAVFNGGYLSGSNSYGGSISQTVTVTPGQTYDLSFDAGIYAASTGSKTQNFSVTAVGSGTLLSQSLSRSTSVTGSAWAGETFSFVADSASVTITFAGAASSASSDLLLDNVSLLPAAAGNSAPVAVDDSYAAVKNVPLNVSAPGVLDNDTDVDLDTLTATVVANPSNGSLTLNSDGSFTYTPTTDYVGPDSFTYMANDGTDDSNTATVTITVSEPTFELAVESSPATGIGITVSPADNGSNSDGATNFTRTYNGGTEVTLTAPSISATTVFEKWQRDGSDYSTEATAVVTMDADYTMTAVYVANTPPVAVDDSYSTTEDVDLEV
ncbi:MAG: DUF642 domain-containing protein, partial [Verrucomicrobiae bacterium]|nr:DUF642 domain-containing protein [Verrucomicrobiae bacterium]